MTDSSKDLNNDYKRALNYALRLLSAREYSRFELLSKLKAKFTYDVSLQVLKTCDEYNYVSDSRCAQMLINHMQSCHYGPTRLFMESRKRRINDDVVKDLIEDVDWLSLACELLDRKIKDFPKTPNERNKILSFLYRRGFSAGICYKALEIVKSKFLD